MSVPRSSSIRRKSLLYGRQGDLDRLLEGKSLIIGTDKREDCYNIMTARLYNGRTGPRLTL